MAHLDQAQAKLINYIGASTNHSFFMLGKTLSLEAGVTGDAFKEPEPVADENGVIPER